MSAWPWLIEKCTYKGDKGQREVWASQPAMRCSRENKNVFSIMSIVMP